VTTLVKWFAVSRDSIKLENLAIVLIIITLMGSLYQGKSGGSIVYQYTGGIDSQVIIQRASQK